MTCPQWSDKEMCFYAEDNVKLGYSLSFIMMMFPDSQQGSKATAGRYCVGFLDLDIFTDQDPDSNKKWPKWVLDNHDAFFYEGKIVLPCKDLLERAANNLTSYFESSNVNPKNSHTTKNKR